MAIKEEDWIQEQKVSKTTIKEDAKKEEADWIQAMAYQ